MAFTEWRTRRLIIALPMFAVMCVLSITYRHRHVFVQHHVGIVIHHSAVVTLDDGTPVNAAVLDRLHRQRGFGTFVWPRRYSIGYHYVVLPSGQIETGRPEGVRGAHTIGANDHIGICVIGNFDDFDSAPIAESQLSVLASLVARLMATHGWDASRVRLHTEVDPSTVCPGRRFPIVRLRSELKKIVTAAQESKEVFWEEKASQ